MLAATSTAFVAVLLLCGSFICAFEPPHSRLGAAACFNHRKITLRTQRFGTNPSPSSLSACTTGLSHESVLAKLSSWRRDREYTWSYLDETEQRQMLLDLHACRHSMRTSDIVSMIADLSALGLKLHPSIGVGQKYIFTMILMQLPLMSCDQLTNTLQYMHDMGIMWDTLSPQPVSIILQSLSFTLSRCDQEEEAARLVKSFLQLSPSVRDTHIIREVFINYFKARSFDSVFDAVCGPGVPWGRPESQRHSKPPGQAKISTHSNSTRSQLAEFPADNGEWPDDTEKHDMELDNIDRSTDPESDPHNKILSKRIFFLQLAKLLRSGLSYRGIVGQSRAYEKWKAVLDLMKQLPSRDVTPELSLSLLRVMHQRRLVFSRLAPTDREFFIQCVGNSFRQSRHTAQLEVLQSLREVKAEWTTMYPGFDTDVRKFVQSFCAGCSLRELQFASHIFVGIPQVTSALLEEDGRHLQRIFAAAPQLSLFEAVDWLKTFNQLNISFFDLPQAVRYNVTLGVAHKYPTPATLQGIEVQLFKQMISIVRWHNFDADFREWLVNTLKSLDSDSQTRQQHSTTDWTYADIRAFINNELNGSVDVELRDFYKCTCVPTFKPKVSGALPPRVSTILQDYSVAGRMPVRLSSVAIVSLIDGLRFRKISWNDLSKTDQRNLLNMLMSHQDTIHSWQFNRMMCSLAIMGLRWSMLKPTFRNLVLIKLSKAYYEHEEWLPSVAFRALRMLEAKWDDIPSTAQTILLAQFACPLLRYAPFPETVSVYVTLASLGLTWQKLPQSVKALTLVSFSFEHTDNEAAIDFLQSLVAINAPWSELPDLTRESMIKYAVPDTPSDVATQKDPLLYLTKLTKTKRPDIGSMLSLLESKLLEKKCSVLNPAEKNDLAEILSAAEAFPNLLSSDLCVRLFKFLGKHIIFWHQIQKQHQKLLLQKVLGLTECVDVATALNALCHMRLAWTELPSSVRNHVIMHVEESGYSWKVQALQDGLHALSLMDARLTSTAIQELKNSILSHVGSAVPSALPSFVWHYDYLSPGDPKEVVRELLPLIATRLQGSDRPISIILAAAVAWQAAHAGVQLTDLPAPIRNWLLVMSGEVRSEDLQDVTKRVCTKLWDGWSMNPNALSEGTDSKPVSKSEQLISDKYKLIMPVMKLVRYTADPQSIREEDKRAFLRSLDWFIFTPDDDVEALIAVLSGLRTGVISHSDLSQLRSRGLMYKIAAGLPQLNAGATALLVQALATADVTLSCMDLQLRERLQQEVAAKFPNYGRAVFLHVLKALCDVGGKWSHLDPNLRDNLQRAICDGSRWWSWQEVTQIVSYMGNAEADWQTLDPKMKRFFRGWLKRQRPQQAGETLNSSFQIWVKALEKMRANLSPEVEGSGYVLEMANNMQSSALVSVDLELLRRDLDEPSTFVHNQEV